MTGYYENIKRNLALKKVLNLYKDDRFQVDSVFFKTPARIEALMMVMTLCLMVYGLSEYELHRSLQASNQQILNQSKKLTARPSLSWIYFLFRGVNELCIKTGNQIKKLVINVNPLLKQIIGHFGERAKYIYFNSS